jgi:hypothetical protein
MRYSKPFALRTGTAIGAIKSLMKAVAASTSLAAEPTAAERRCGTTSWSHYHKILRMFGRRHNGLTGSLLLVVGSTLRQEVNGKEDGHVPFRLAEAAELFHRRLRMLPAALDGDWFANPSDQSEVTCFAIHSSSVMGVRLMK